MTVSVLGDSSAIYAAGIFDGEGTVTIRLRPGGRANKPAEERKRYHDVQVSIGSTDEVLILWLQERWPGTINVHRYANERYKQLYRWVTSGAKAEQFLRAIRPWVVIKGARIDLAIALRETKIERGELLTPALYEEREQMREKLMTLNKRGA